MGWFSKKKGLDTPPSLDAPPPISSEDKQSFGLSEPDIPPIHSMSDMKQKEFRMKEFKIGSDEEVPLPPSELKEEKDAFPEFPSFPDLPKEFPENIKQEKKYKEMQFVQEEETPPEIVSRLPFEHYSQKDFPSEDEIKEILKPNIPDFDRLLKQDTKQKPKRISSFITLTQYKMIMLQVMQMNDLVEWTQNALEENRHHPLLVIGNFLVEFLKIHPFTDGNGRLSRVLTNLLLLQAGYAYIPYVSHEKLVEDNKPDYYIALRRSQKTMGTKKETITDWLDFFLDIILKQAHMAVELLSKENIEKILSEKQLIVWQYIEKTRETSTGDVVENTKIARPTVKQTLDVLLKLKKIERVGLGRSARYRIL